MAQSKRPDPDVFPELYGYANNGTPSRRTHTERKVYRGSVVPIIGPKLRYNFWGEDRYLGRINNKGYAVRVNEQSLKPLRYTEEGKTLFALNFVADAWRDFMDRVTDLADRGILNPSGPYAAPRATKAFTSVTSEYHDYMVTLVYRFFATEYLNIFPTEEREIVDLESFLNVFTAYAEMITKKTGPMSVAGFVESNFCSPVNSGLVIEIAEGRHDDDYTKSTRYFMDDNFSLITAIASQYGFALDQNAPWRFVADVRSPAMREYMSGVELTVFPGDPRNTEDDCGNPIIRTDFAFDDPYGYSQIPGYANLIRHAPGYPEFSGAYEARSVEDVHDILYKGAFIECWRTDMDILKIYLLDFYNALIAKRPSVSVLVDTGEICPTSKVDVIERLPAIREEFTEDGKYGNRWNLKSYYLLRRFERRQDEGTRVIRENLREVMNVYNFATGDTNLKYILALGHLQDQMIAPIIRMNFKLGTLGDIV